MSKIWIPAVLVTAISGAVLGLILANANDPGTNTQAGAQPAPTSSPANPAPLPPTSAAPMSTAPVQAGAQPRDSLIPTAIPPAAQPNELSLWSRDSLSEADQYGMPVHLTQVDPTLLDQFSVGQTLELSLPGRSDPLRSTLEQTRNNAGAAVWQGKLIDGDEAESLTVVRGQIETHITVATLDGTLSVIIDNQSGKAVITDENELVLRADPNDQMDYDDSELPPLQPPAQS
jgi:hypothetical protein